MVARNARVWDPAVAGVRKFCDQRVPAEARDQVRLEVTTWASTITIVEHRPLWQGGRVRGPACRSPNFVTTLPRAPGPCTGRIATDAGIGYDHPDSTLQLDELLKEIDQDSLSLFWG